MNEQTDAPPEAAAPIPDEQLLAALQVPTTYINRFSIMVSANSVKLTFFEQATADASQAVPRHSVAMDKDGAAMLCNMLAQFFPPAPQK